MALLTIQETVLSSLWAISSILVLLLCVMVAEMNCVFFSFDMIRHLQKKYII